MLKRTALITFLSASLLVALPSGYTIDSVRLRSDGIALVNDVPFFPVMAYRSSSLLGTTSASENTFEAALRDLPKIKAEGYNVAHNYCFETSSPTPPLSAQQAIDYLKAADSLGLRVFLGVHRPYIDTFPKYESALRELVETVTAANTKSLFMWYLRDEPLFDAVQGRSVVNTIRAADPFHLTHYDHYATSALQVGQRLSWFDSTGVDTWSMQCYDTWGDNVVPFNSFSKGTGKYVVERLDQTSGLLNDVFASIASGANGYMSYIYLTEPPLGIRYLDAMRLNQELRFLEPVLTQPQSPFTIQTNLNRGLLLRSQIDQRDGSAYLLVVNRNGTIATPEFTFLGSKALASVERVLDHHWLLDTIGGTTSIIADSGTTDLCLSIDAGFGTGNALLSNLIGYQSRYAVITLILDYEVRSNQTDIERNLISLGNGVTHPVALKLGSNGQFQYKESDVWKSAATYAVDTWIPVRYTVRLDTLAGNTWDLSINGSSVANAIPFTSEQLSLLEIGVDNGNAGVAYIDNIRLVHNSAHASSTTLFSENFNSYPENLPPRSSVAITTPRTFSDTIGAGQVCHYKITLGSDINDTLLFHYSRDFTQTQGANNCRYRYRTGATFADMIFDSVKGRWAGNETYLYLSNGGMHPGVNSDPVLQWTCSVNGLLNIVGTVRKSNISAGDGIIATIKRNETVIWGPSSVAWNDAIGLSHNIVITADSGDLFSFSVNKNGNDGADGTFWDPQVYMEIGGATNLQAFHKNSFPILSAYPNPFNASVEVSVANMNKPHSLCVYDIRGAKVADLTKQISNDALGFHANWNALKHPAGIYFIRLHNETKILNLKIVLTR